MDYRSSNTDAGADRTWNDILFVSIFMQFFRTEFVS